MRQRGRRFSDPYFSVSVLTNQASCPRLALSIATRTLGTAVARNLVKRIARESFRLNQHDLPPADFMVSARDAARRASPRELRASLDGHFRKIRERG